MVNLSQADLGEISSGIIRRALPDSRVLEANPLNGGLRNSVIKLRLDTHAEPLVLRIFNHDPCLCQKELDLYELIGGSVPVPEVIYAEVRTREDLPPFTLARFVDGISFLELKRGGETKAIAEAAHSAGQILAEIGRITFEAPGWLKPGAAAGAPLLAGERPIPRFVDGCLSSMVLQRQMPADLLHRTSAAVWSWAVRLDGLGGEAHLVHGDFSRRNLVVRQIAGCWSVAAVLDWEFAMADSPLWDVANFLRYERALRPLAEPHFSAGYLQAGGALPENWRMLAQILDLAAICEMLTRKELPVTVMAELVELVRATVDEAEALH